MFSTRVGPQLRRIHVHWRLQPTSAGERSEACLVGAAVPAMLLMELLMELLVELLVASDSTGFYSRLSLSPSLGLWRLWCGSC